MLSPSRTESKPRRASESSATSSVASTSGSSAKASTSSANAMNGANYRKSSFPKPPKGLQAAIEQQEEEDSSSSFQGLDRDDRSTSTSRQGPPIYLPPGIGFNVTRQAPQRDDLVIDPAVSSTRKSKSPPSSNTTDTSSFRLPPAKDTGFGTPYTSTAALAVNPDGSPRRRSLNDVAIGEDSGLVAARRALWADTPAPDKSTPTTADVEHPEPKSNIALVSSSSESEDDQVSKDQLEQEDEDDDEGERSDASSTASVDLPPVPSPHEPAHTTKMPARPCLRLRSSLSSRLLSSSSNASSSRRPSMSRSSSNGTASVETTAPPPTVVQFSDECETALTYSPIDYERRSETGPVEKLSIRDWIELRDVREAIGVWSGRIEPWDPMSDSVDTLADGTNHPAVDSQNDRLRKDPDDHHAAPLHRSSSSTGHSGTAPLGSPLSPLGHAGALSSLMNGSSSIHHGIYHRSRTPSPSSSLLLLNPSSSSSSAAGEATIPSTNGVVVERTGSPLVHHHSWHGPAGGVTTQRGGTINNGKNDEGGKKGTAEGGGQQQHEEDSKRPASRYSHISGAASVLTVGGAAHKR